MIISMDKILHFLASFWICIVLYTVLKNKTLAIVLTLLIGIGKEVSDIWFGVCDPEDLVANVAGILSAMVVMKDLRAERWLNDE